LNESTCLDEEEENSEVRTKRVPASTASKFSKYEIILVGLHKSKLSQNTLNIQDFLDQTLPETFSKQERGLYLDHNNQNSQVNLKFPLASPSPKIPYTKNFNLDSERKGK
jgi:hypothetical protein